MNICLLQARASCALDKVALFIVLNGGLVNEGQLYGQLNETGIFISTALNLILPVASFINRPN